MKRFPTKNLCQKISAEKFLYHTIGMHTIGIHTIGIHLYTYHRYQNNVLNLLMRKIRTILITPISVFRSSLKTPLNYVLEPVCCKKQQKKISWQVTGLRNRGPLNDLNNSKLIVCIWVQVIPLISQDQFYTIQNLQSFPIPQISNWAGTFFSVS